MKQSSAPRHARKLIAGVVFLLGGLVRADHGDPSTRPNPIPPPYVPDAKQVVGALTAEGLTLTLTVTPPDPRAGELIRTALNIHDPEQDRDFQGDVKVTVKDAQGVDLATGPALTDEGEAAFLVVAPAGGTIRVNFEFDADIPAWTPSRLKRPGPSTPPLAVGSDGKGKVWCEYLVAEDASTSAIPLPWIVGGAVVLLLAAVVFLRRR